MSAGKPRSRGVPVDFAYLEVRVEASPALVVPMTEAESRRMWGSLLSAAATRFAGSDGSPELIPDVLDCAREGGAVALLRVRSSRLSYLWASLTLFSGSPSCGLPSCRILATRCSHSLSSMSSRSSRDFERDSLRLLPSSSD